MFCHVTNFNALALGQPNDIQLPWSWLLPSSILLFPYILVGVVSAHESLLPHQIGGPTIDLK